MLKTIILALNASEIEICDRTIEALNKINIQAETKIIFSHVVAPLDSDDNLTVDRPHQTSESIYQNLEKYLDFYSDRLPGKLEIEIANGDPAEEIVRLANIHQADLIVIGNRGLKGFDRVIEGSVSSQVVADAPCSVLVVKLHD